MVTRWTCQHKGLSRKVTRWTSQHKGLSKKVTRWTCQHKGLSKKVTRWTCQHKGLNKMVTRWPHSPIFWRALIPKSEVPGPPSCLRREEYCQRRNFLTFKRPKSGFPRLGDCFVDQGNQSPMRPVFKDSALQSTFDRLGYAPIPGFLTSEEVEALKKAYFDTLPQRGGSMLSEETDHKTDAAITYDFTFIDRNPEYKKLVFKLITERFQSLYDQYLDNYKPIIANFIRKEQDSGEVPLHQNWAFVDERKFTSVSIWVPLIDSNEANGTLQMVDGSHKRFGEIRGPLVPWELEGIKKEIIGQYLTPMNVHAGDAVVLDDSVVHYSNVNQTNGLRLTIQLILIPAETESIHYYLDPEGDGSEVTVFEVDHEFYMHFHPWLKPEAKVVGTRKFKANSLDRSGFERGLKAPQFDLAPARKEGFFDRIKRIFA